jgi:glycosyltransferase involved in cell wall biosynthesis
MRTLLKVVPNGVNIRQFFRNPSEAKSLRQKLGIGPGDPVIGTVAVFRTQKRLDVWLDVAARIIAQMPSVKFIVVGDGPLRDDIVAKSRKVLPTGSVFFPGLQTDVRPYLSAFDIFMMSSVFEGMPVALLEAMSCHCAIIATNAGGTGEVVMHNRDGFLCDVTNPMKLADYALLLLRDDLRRQQLASAARIRVQQKFSMDTMIKALEDIYLSFVNGKAS